MTKPVERLWEVRGKSDKSGKPCTIRIRALDYDDAVRKATDTMFIEDVVLVERAPRVTAKFKKDMQDALRARFKGMNIEVI